MTNKMLGKYELLEELGRGGFGTVYHARYTSLEVERAVKILHAVLVASPEFIERFRREAKVSARLDHPNIVPVYEFGEQEGAYYLVMKYLPGGSLKDVLAKAGPLPFVRAVEITRQIAGALEYAYAQPEKLIHRDIKPGNILFEADGPAGKGGAARLADFGFAKALAGDDSSSLSASGGMIGTPPYMAPEIWRHKEFTPATDVYSLACVFYEMITGKVLFKGDSPADIMTMHVLDGPQFPQQWPEGVPDGIEGVLGKALARDPKERYQSVSEFAAALEEIVSGNELPVQSEKTIVETVIDQKVSVPEAIQEKIIEPQVPPLPPQPFAEEQASKASLQLEEALPVAGEEVLMQADKAINQTELEKKEAMPAMVSESTTIAVVDLKESIPPIGKTEEPLPVPVEVPAAPAPPRRVEPGSYPREKKPKRKFPVWAIVMIVLVGVIAIVGIVSLISNPFLLSPQATQSVSTLATQPPAATLPPALQSTVVTQPPTAIQLPTATELPVPSAPAGGRIKIGLSFSDFATERWPIEAAQMTQLLQAKGYEVILEEADHDANKQNNQIDAMVAQGVKGLIVIAEDSAAAVTPVNKAAAAGIPVISYDRLIKTDKIAAYISFDNVEVGKQEALGIMTALGLPGSTTWTKANPAKVVLSGGSPTDNNAVLVHQGQMEIVQPYIDAGIVKIVADQWVDNWDPAYAKAMMERILTAQQNKIDAVIASNDGTALGELQVLAAHGLAGKVPISGQDATAEGCNSIVKSQQTVTIFKDTRLLAPKAVEMMDALIRGHSISGLQQYSLAILTGDRTLTGNIQAAFLPIVQVTKANVYDLVVRSGFQNYDNVYSGVPADQLPARP